MGSKTRPVRKWPQFAMQVFESTIVSSQYPCLRKWQWGSQEIRRGSGWATYMFLQTVFRYNKCVTDDGQTVTILRRAISATVSTGPVTPGSTFCMKNARGARWKWFVRRCSSSFVTRSSSALHQHFWFVTIRFRASSSAHNYFEHVQNCAPNSTHNRKRQKDTRRTPDMRGRAMDQRPIHAIHAEHSLDIRCMFVGWDVELLPYLWWNWWQARQLQVSFKHGFYILGPPAVTTTPLRCLHGQKCARDLLSRDRDETETRRCSFRDAGRDLEAPDTFESLGSFKERLAETFSVTYGETHWQWKNYTD